MRQWETTLEFHPKMKPFKSFWYWSVRLPATEEWESREIGFGRATTLSEALDEIDRTIDLDLNNDFA
jgi:hypothetical protein